MGPISEAGSLIAVRLARAGVHIAEGVVNGADRTPRKAIRDLLNGVFLASDGRVVLNEDQHVPLVPLRRGRIGLCDGSGQTAFVVDSKALETWDRRRE